MFYICSQVRSEGENKTGLKCPLKVDGFLQSLTVNVVIFAGGKFRENGGKTFHVGVIFPILLLFSFIKAYGFYFRTGVIFAKKTKVRKTRKLPPRENFHVYSITSKDSAVICQLKERFSI